MHVVWLCGCYTLLYLVFGVCTYCLSKSIYYLSWTIVILQGIYILMSYYLPRISSLLYVNLVCANKIQLPNKYGIVLRKIDWPIVPQHGRKTATPMARLMKKKRLTTIYVVNINARIFTHVTKSMWYEMKVDFKISDIIIEILSFMKDYRIIS